MPTSDHVLTCVTIAIPIFALLVFKRVIEDVIGKTISWPRSFLIALATAALSGALVSVAWLFRGSLSAEKIDQEGWLAIMLAASWLATAIVAASQAQGAPRPLAVLLALKAVPLAILGQALCLIATGISAGIATYILMLVVLAVAKGFFTVEPPSALGFGIWGALWLITYVRGFHPGESEATNESYDPGYDGYTSPTYSTSPTPGYTAPVMPSPGYTPPSYTPPPPAPAYYNGLSQNEYASRQIEWTKQYG